MLGTTTAVFLHSKFHLLLCCLFRKCARIDCTFLEVLSTGCNTSSTVVTTLHFRMFRSRPQPILLPPELRAIILSLPDVDQT